MPLTVRSSFSTSLGLFTMHVHIGAEIVMNCTVSGVGTAFLQKSLRSGLLWPRRADNLNPRTFKFLHITWSLHDARHIGAEIVMNCTV